MTVALYILGLLMVGAALVLALALCKISGTFSRQEESCRKR